MRFTSALQLVIVKVVVYSETVWSEDPGCPDCSKIRCESDLQEADCPDDTILTPKVLFWMLYCMCQVLRVRLTLSGPLH